MVVDDPEILRISRELDLLLNKYSKLKSIKRD